MIHRRPVSVGERITVVLPFSEVCYSMGIADQAMGVELLGNGMVQLYGQDGLPFSFPIGSGEAGIYSDADGMYVIADARPLSDEPSMPYATR